MLASPLIMFVQCVLAGQLVFGRAGQSNSPLESMALLRVRAAGGVVLRTCFFRSGGVLVYNADNEICDERRSIRYTDRCRGEEHTLPPSYYVKTTRYVFTVSRTAFDAYASQPTGGVCGPARCVRLCEADFVLRRSRIKCVPPNTETRAVEAVPRRWRSERPTRPKEARETDMRHSRGGVARLSGTVSAT